MNQNIIDEVSVVLPKMFGVAILALLDFIYILTGNQPDYGNEVVLVTTLKELQEPEHMEEVSMVLPRINKC